MNQPTRNPPSSETASSAEPRVVAFLSDPTTYGLRGETVERITTHGAFIFLAGDEAYKIKRAVKLPYMDFSTLEARQHVIAKEFALNLPNAHEIYLGVVPVAETTGGKLVLGGGGRVIEWLLHMRRFDTASVLAKIADAGELTPELAKATADAIIESHARAKSAPSADGAARLRNVAGGLAPSFDELRAELDAPRATALIANIEREIIRIAPLLDRRSRSGDVRRCHGDLHTGNIVVWKGAPKLFDALEFDDELATVDVLYDLAFLLMDLCHRGQARAANLVLNRYLWRNGRAETLDGLAALPVFLALRAAIRAMVTAERGRSLEDHERRAARGAADGYLRCAERHLVPAPPMLIATGGLSGSGKSVLAAALAPLVGAAPGAIHFRSDLERKSFFGVGEFDHLPEEAYARDTTETVYSILAAKARRALAAGATVIVDAVFASEVERHAMEAVGREAGVPFFGLWLDAPQDVLLTRVSQRRGDASDATTAIVAKQAGYDLGNLGWMRVDASGAPDATLASALKLLPARDGITTIRHP